MYKENVVLNNLQLLICSKKKTNPINQPTNQQTSIKVVKLSRVIQFVPENQIVLK